MPKFAVYQALMTRNDWKQERQDKSMQLALAERQTAMQKAKAQEELQFQEQMGEYFQALENIPFTEQDQDRIKEAELRERKNIIEGIKKHNGDVLAYKHSGGLMSLKNYRQNVLKSEEVQTGIANKNSLASYVKAKKENKYITPVTVQIPEEDSEGNKVYKNKQVSFQEAFAMFQDGKIQKLPEVYAEDNVEVDPMVFRKHLKDPLNPFSRNNIVTESDMYKQYLEAGASKQQAYAKSNEYGKFAKATGNWNRWGTDQIYSLAMQRERLDLEKAKFGFQQDVKFYELENAQKQYKKIDAAINEITSMKEGSKVKPIPKLQDYFIAASGGQVNKQLGGYKFKDSGLTAIDNTGNPIDISMFESVTPTEVVKENGRTYFTGTGYLKEDMDMDGSPLQSTFGWTSAKNKNNFEELPEKIDGNNLWRGPVKIDITDMIHNNVHHHAIQEWTDLYSTGSYVAPHGTTSGYNIQNAQETSSAQQKMQEQYNVDPNEFYQGLDQMDEE